MANRYWVGGTATWDGTAGTKWATTSGGAGGASVPTASDDVFIDANSGSSSVTMASGAICRTLNCTGFTGILIHSSAFNMTIAGGLILPPFPYYTKLNANSSAFTFTATSTYNINCNGNTLGNVSFNGNGGVWNFQSDAAFSNNFTFTRGTINTNNYTLNLVNFATSGTNAKTLNLGSSSVNFLGSTWNVINTSLTVNPGTSTITLSNTAATFTGGTGRTYNNVVFSNCLSATINSNCTIANLTVNGGNDLTARFRVASDFTISGVFTMTAFSSSRRLHLVNPQVSTSRTITCNGSVSFSHVTVLYITAAGSASWNLSGATGGCGDAGGNSGITFTSPTTWYWYQNGGSLSASISKLFTATAGGGSVATRLPLPQDTIIFDSSSFSSGSQTVTLDLYYMGSVSCVGVTNTPTINPTNNTFFTNDVTFNTSVAMDAVATFQIATHQNININFGGLVITPSITVSTYSSAIVFLTGDVSCTSFTVARGNCELEGIDLLTTSSFVVQSSTGVTSFKAGSGKITVQGTLASLGDTAVYDCETSTLELHPVVGGQPQTLTSNFSGVTLYNLVINGTSIGSDPGDTLINPSLPGLTVLNDFLIYSPAIIDFNFHTLNVYGNFKCIGATDPNYTATSIDLSKGRLYQFNDYVTMNNCYLTDFDNMRATVLYAGAGSLNAGGNLNWSFTNPPPKNINAPIKAFDFDIYIPTVEAEVLAPDIGVPSKVFASNTQVPFVASGAGFSIPVNNFAFQEQDPSVSVGRNILTPTRIFDLDGYIVDVQTSLNVNAPRYDFSLDGPNPLVSVGVSILSPTSNFDLEGQTGFVSIGVNLVSDFYSFTLTSLEAALATGASVSSPLRSFDLENQAPFIAAGASVGSPSKQFILSGLNAAVYKGANILSPYYSFDAVGAIPSIASIVNVPLYEFLLTSYVPSAATGRLVVAPNYGFVLDGLDLSHAGEWLVLRINVPLKEFDLQEHTPVVASGSNFFIPTKEFTLIGGASYFKVNVIKFSGDPVPAAHFADALKLDADAYVELFEIILADKSTKIYLTLNHDKFWQGHTYEGTGVQMDGVAAYSDDQVSRPKMTIFNPEGVYSYLIDQGLLDGATVARIRLLKEHLDSDQPIYRKQQWKVSRVASVRNHTIGLELRDMFDGQMFITPGRMFIPPDFPMVSLN